MNARCGDHRRAPEQPAAIAIWIRIRWRRHALAPIGASQGSNGRNSLEQAIDRAHQLQGAAEVPSGYPPNGTREARRHLQSTVVEELKFVDPAPQSIADRPPSCGHLSRRAVE